jgi:hypothetical protein
MYRKFAGDSIAQEMARLLKISSDSKLSSSADDEGCADDSSKQEDSAKSPIEDKMEDDASDSSEKKEWCAADFINDEDEELDDVEDSMSDAMNSVADFADDKDEKDMLKSMSSLGNKNQRLMIGLGKIEASLRRKGEDFAADLVKVTASEIKEDIVKEARLKQTVKTELVKMSARLNGSGNKKAANLVRDTLLSLGR